jgi:hypothetical protein
MSIKPNLILFSLCIIFSFGCNSTEPAIKYDENVKLVEFINIDEWANDPVNIISASLENDVLSLNVQFSGGCKDHFFKLIISEGIEESNPPQTTFFLSHDSNGDTCEALISEELRFNLIVYKEYLQNTLNPSEIIIKFYGSDIRTPYFY